MALSKKTDSIVINSTKSIWGVPIGSAGPTTSYRMDDLTVPLLEKGLKIMIGKGKRNDVVIEGMKKYKAVYLAAIGGAGAYISNSIKEMINLINGLFFIMNGIIKNRPFILVLKLSFVHL